MVEIVGGVVRHAELFHHAARAQISGEGERDEARELERIEGVIDDGARAFCRETAAPMVGSYRHPISTT